MVFVNNLDLDLIVIIHFWKLGRLQRKPGIERRHNIKYVRYSRCKIVCRKYVCTTFPICMILKPHKKDLESKKNVCNDYCSLSCQIQTDWTIGNRFTQSQGFLVPRADWRAWIVISSLKHSDILNSIWRNAWHPSSQERWDCLIKPYAYLYEWRC